MPAAFRFSILFAAALAVLAQGPLSLDEADLEDHLILQTTLYKSISVEDIHESTFVRDLVEKQAEEMIAASQRRLERQDVRIEQALKNRSEADDEVMKKLFAERKQRAEMAYLAIDRANVIRTVVESAKADERMRSARRKLTPMERFNGNGVFTPSDLRKVESAYSRQFRRTLPISADGDTSLHRALGLDHTGRVDVAVLPDSPEGMWLRSYLEARRIPYYAFRKAVIGSATAPHIHIGPGSTRRRQIASHAGG